MRYVFSSGSVRLPSLRLPNRVIRLEGFSSRSLPSATSPAANSGDKTLSVMISGLAPGTPLTILLKTRTLSAAAFERPIAASAMLAAMSEQYLASSEFLRVSFIIWLFCFLFVFVGAAIDRTLEHLHADCDDPV